MSMSMRRWLLVVMAVMVVLVMVARACAAAAAWAGQAEHLCSLPLPETRAHLVALQTGPPLPVELTDITCRGGDKEEDHSIHNTNIYWEKTPQKKQKQTTTQTSTVESTLL